MRKIVIFLKKFNVLYHQKIFTLFATDFVQFISDENVPHFLILFWARVLFSYFVLGLRFLLFCSGLTLFFWVCGGYFISGQKSFFLFCSLSSCFFLGGVVFCSGLTFIFFVFCSEFAFWGILSWANVVIFSIFFWILVFFFFIQC